MAYEEVSTRQGDFSDRKYVSPKIGTELEGIFQGMSPRLPSQFGGEYRMFSLDATDGRKLSVPAGKILLDRIEAAHLTEGDKIRIVVGSETSKQGRQYALPRVYVDRSETTAPMSEDPPF